MKKENQKSSLPTEGIRALGLFGLIIADFVGFTSAGMGLGYWLNQKFQISLWISILLGFLGLALAIYRLTRYVKRDSK